MEIKLTEIIVGGVFTIVGVILKIAYDYYKSNAESSEKIRLDTIKNSINALKELVSSMLKVRTKMEVLMKNSNKNFKASELETLSNEIKDCLACFNENRLDLYIFIAKDESPMFIDYIITLYSCVDSLMDIDEKKDKDEIMTICKSTFSSFSKLYDEYYKNYLELIRIVIQKKKFH